MKIKYFPYQPHCFAFGGFDMQMINTLTAVKNTGVEADKLEVWSRDKDFDILHLWGIGRPNFEIIDWAKKAGKMIIATILLPYHDTARSKLGYGYRRFLSGAGSQLMHYLNLLDKIVVVNELQKNVLHNYYKVPLHKIAVIPNIVEDQYFERPSFDFSKQYGVSNYVLCTGNISPRKNQYNLALACINLNVQLVLIGNTLDGEMNYGKKTEALAATHSNIVWIKELPKASDELVGAYHNCAVYALPSKEETQPISALEAVAMQKSLVLMDRMYARQSFYKGAVLCKSPLVKDIEVALTAAMYIKSPATQNLEIRNCRSEMVGEQYKNCYLDLMK